MSDAATCILVVGENHAAVYDSRQGISHINHVVLRSHAQNIATGKASRAFAFRLISDFSYDAQKGIYDGLIIMAVPSMLDVIRDQLPPEVRKLLIMELPCSTAVVDVAVPRDREQLVA